MTVRFLKKKKGAMEIRWPEVALASRYLSHPGPSWGKIPAPKGVFNDRILQLQILSCEAEDVWREIYSVHSANMSNNNSQRRLKVPLSTDHLSQALKSGQASDRKGF